MRKTNNTRNIIIKTDFVRMVYELFREFSVQLSDGYWENSCEEWGEYGYYTDIWNCFEYSIGEENNFVITLKDKPICEDSKTACDLLHKYTDEELVEYLVNALIISIENYPDVFDNYFSKNELNILIDSIKNFKILPPPLPKLTHAELVKIIGYDFEYVR
ncbi:MAG: hypothetical protein VZS44_09770 [Bacilli bacterium]|nr:hypothetical protein [Bacilli bacterium]